MKSTAIFKCSAHGVWPGLFVRLKPRRAFHLLVHSTQESKAQRATSSACIGRAAIA